MRWFMTGAVVIFLHVFCLQAVTVEQYSVFELTFEDPQREIHSKKSG